MRQSNLFFGNHVNLTDFKNCKREAIVFILVMFVDNGHLSFMFTIYKHYQNEHNA